MKCANCGTALSCGCQKRTTKDGKQMCTNCIHKPKPVAKTIDTPK
jgi:hypothetical protein